MDNVASSHTKIIEKVTIKPNEPSLALLMQRNTLSAEFRGITGVQQDAT